MLTVAGSVAAAAWVHSAGFRLDTMHLSHAKSSKFNTCAVGELRVTTRSVHDSASEP